VTSTINTTRKEEDTMKRSILAFLKVVVSIIAVLVFVVAVSGCQKQEGPMEKAGKKADEGIEATKDAIKKAGEKVGEGVEATKEAVKSAAEKVDEKAKE
jgi:hypothetical protein